MRGGPIPPDDFKANCCSTCGGLGLLWDPAQAPAPSTSQPVPDEAKKAAAKVIAIALRRRVEEVSTGFNDNVTPDEVAEEALQAAAPAIEEGAVDRFVEKLLGELEELETWRLDISGHFSGPEFWRGDEFPGPEAITVLYLPAVKALIRTAKGPQ
jgi:hypothetical protein